MQAMRKRVHVSKGRGEVMKWIRLKDKKPDFKQTPVVLGYGTWHDEYFLCDEILEWDEGVSYLSPVEGDDGDTGILYWMPLPGPPNVVDVEEQGSNGPHPFKGGNCEPCEVCGRSQDSDFHDESEWAK